MKNKLFQTLLVALLVQNQVYSQLTSSVSINTTAGLRKPISPFIYGLNGYVHDPEGGTMTGLDNHGGASNVQAMNPASWRLGGNAMSTWNWEQGANNAGNDDGHKNSTWQSWMTGIGSANPAPAYFTPNQGAIKANNDALSLDANLLLQLPSVGYVAADNVYTTCGTPAADPSRWKQVINDKPGTPGSLTLSPDLGDGAVYVDEQINHLINQFGNSAAANGIKHYQMDNELGLWSHYPSGGNTGTHSVAHPSYITCGEMINKTVNLSQTVKRMDMGANVFTSGLWAYSEWYSLYSVWDGSSHQPSDWGTYNVEPYKTNNTGQTYRYNRMTWLNAFLANLKQASTAAGKRLVDVLAIHYYPEGIYSDAIRVQAPRSLWDPNYVENTWITAVGNGFTDGRSLEVLPKMNLSISDFYPGTKLAITEYTFGGRHNISGTIAQSDALGIFGRYGLYWATYFATADDYISPAFKIFRNYNGALGTFGDTYIDANTNDVTNNSVYASIVGANENDLHIVLINKSPTQTLTNNINITAGVNYEKIAEAWGISESQGNTDIMVKSNINDLTGTNTIVGNALRYTLPANSVYHLVLETNVLSVGLKDFKGKLNKDKSKILITWTTESESNNKGFEIQRSCDGINFTNFMFQKGAGTKSTPTVYSITDETPFEGNNYYRLKQIDLDGKSKYSPIIIVSNISAVKDEIQLFPNPATNMISLISNNSNIKKTYRISGFDGSTFGSGSFTDSIDIPVIDLSAGIYFIEIQNSKGDQINLKFVKK